MGNNALKHITERKPREEFEFIRHEIEVELRKHFSRIKVPEYHNSKDDFGDLDVLCQVDENFNRNMRDFIKEEFNPKDIFHNGNNWSFEYKNFQIDLILTPPKNFRSSYYYLSYAPLGNILGRIYHRLGLKFGHDGLTYVYRIEDKVLGVIKLSHDFYEILNFLGLNELKWEVGFKDLEDIFKFVTTSKYFDKDIFTNKRFSKITKRRKRKRKKFGKFLDYINRDDVKSNTNLNKYPKLKYIVDAAYYFKNNVDFWKEFKKLKDRHKRKEKVKRKFNGRILMDRFGLKGKELGKAIGNFKNEFGNTKDFEEYVLDASKDKILVDFKEINGL